MRQMGKERIFNFELTEEEKKENEEWKRQIHRQVEEEAKHPRERTPFYKQDDIPSGTELWGYQSRARGAMMGLAVGDALGTTLEFSRPQAPPFPALATGPHRQIIGGGPFHLRPGQVTDDTQMACCLAASLQACNEFNLDDVAGRYLAWSKYAFDVGQQTRAALAAFEAGTPAAKAGRIIWEKAGRKPAGNGSLMRTAPLALFYWDNADLRRESTLADCGFTHFDPRCQLACAVFNTAIATALNNGNESAIYLAMLDEIEITTQFLWFLYPKFKKEILAAREAIMMDLDHESEKDPELYGPELHLLDQAGFVRVAFRLAFWEFRNAPTFEEALIDVVNRGGDADTNAAVAGALCGALACEEEIPQAWRTAVLDALQDDPTSPWATLYHPRVLVDFAESMKPKVLAKSPHAW